MTSRGSPQRPLLAVYSEFDMGMAAEIAMQIEELVGPASVKPKGLLVTSVTVSRNRSLPMRSGCTFGFR